MKNIMIKEYNEKYYPLINNTSIILHSFDHAIKKAGSYDEVMNQLKILGWNDEWKSFVIEAVNYYADFLKGKHQPKFPKNSVVLAKKEYEDLKYKESLLSKTALITKEELLMIHDNCNQVRKETAKEICEMGEGIYELSYRKSDAMPRLVAWIKSNFGVKTKE